MSAIKRLIPLKPVVLAGFQIPMTQEALKENLQQMVGDLPVMVTGVPLPEGLPGIGLRLVHREQGWAVDMVSGDWLVRGDDGSLEVFTEELIKNFRVEDV